MESKGRVINKLALVLLSIVILELVLIGDQVQPVKAIKKKIYLKKLKKLLPLLALVKPKKKIILLPIPIPMFKHSGYHTPNMTPARRPIMSSMGSSSGQSNSQHMHSQQQPKPSSMPMSMQMPIPSSFMMLDEPSMVGVSMLDSSQMMSMDMQLEPSSVGASRPQLAAASPVQAPPVQAIPTPSLAANASDSQPVAMMMPSVTMTIQSEPGGSSNIELSTNMASSGATNASTSLPLRQRPSGEHSDEPGGEHYYSSPWRARAPMSTMSKLPRGERLRMLAPASAAPTRAAGRNQMSVALVGGQRTQLAPVVIIKNQWRPRAQSGQLQQQQQQPAQHQQQQVDVVPDYDELVAVGPPQVMHVYESANGELHALTPTPANPAPSTTETERESGWAPTSRPGADLSGEVNTVTRPPVDWHSQTREHTKSAAGQATSGRLVSPVVKGKQRQAQLHQEKRRPANLSAGY